MEIIPQLNNNSKYFELSFILYNADGSEFMDYNLPIPNYIYKTAQNHTIIMYKIDGYTGTKRNTEYLNDIIARFLITFKDYSIKRTKIFEKRENALKYEKIHKLKDFQNLKSIMTKSKKITERANNIGIKDQTFLALKFYAEELIKKTSICSYDDMLEFAITNFEEKDKSTLRAKCRSIINWYSERDFKIGRVKQKYKNIQEYMENTKMTRTENIIRINKEKGEQKKELILNITTSIFAELYKKKNGKWNYKKIAEELKIKEETVSKYLKTITNA